MVELSSRTIVYIDGFNLYFGIRERGWRKYLWLNMRSFALDLLKADQRLIEVKYFTSRVSDTPKDHEKRKRQAAYIEALETLPDLRIFYGHYLAKPINCHSCAAQWYTHEEKMTDVNIATELMTDAYMNRFDVAMLISGDSDLVPAVNAVRNLFPQKKVVVAFPPGRSSVQLSFSASAFLIIGRKKLADNQLPDSIVKPDGYVLRRPVSWK